MSQRDSSTERAIVRIEDRVAASTDQDAIAIEEPLELRVAGDPLAITMRTPGQDRELALGLLFAEGVIASLSDVGSVAHCGRPGQEGYGNTIDVTPGPGVALQPERTGAMRRGTLTNAACGVCGRRTIEDLLARIEPVPAGPALPIALLWRASDALARHQPGFTRTGALHGAATIDGEGQVLAAHEDVGRHNAVDKVVGSLLVGGHVPSTNQTSSHAAPAVLAVSGRISFEIVQKAATAGIPAICGVSAPTSLAIDMAERAGIALAGFVRERRLNLYAHPERISLS